MSDRYIHVRYGDSDEAEFVALVDETLPLQDSLSKHLQTAIDRRFIPDTVSVDSYSVLRDGHRIDLRQSLSLELQRNGHSESPWTLVDDRAPQLLRVAARVDGVKGPRTHVLTKTITPSRLARLSEAIKPSELFPGCMFSGRAPKRWRVRAAWPGRFWLPWGRWKTQVKDLARDQVVEVGPSLREWRCYKRALMRIGIGLCTIALIITASLMAGCRKVRFEPMSVKAMAVVGKKSFQLPMNKALTRWVPRTASVLLLPDKRPLVETRKSRVEQPTPSTSLVMVRVTCHESYGVIRCPGKDLILNGFVVGNLGHDVIDLQLAPGLYQFNVSTCNDWQMVPERVTGVSAFREIHDGRNMLRLFVPPDSSGPMEATLSIYCGDAKE